MFNSLVCDRVTVLGVKESFRLSLTLALHENRIILRFRRLRRDSRFEVRTFLKAKHRIEK